MKIPFSPPYLDEAIEHEVLDVLRSGWITSGPKVKALEEAMESFTKAETCICVNSWTSGAIMMLKWFGVGKGDEVIIPAYTYAATALAVLHCGATPIMVDVSSDFNINSRQLSAKITDRTKAIIPVDIGGWSANYQSIKKIVEGHRHLFSSKCDRQRKLGRILILSDAAHSFGALDHGRYFHDHADVVIYSMHAVKNLTTAEGGAICLNLPAPFDNKSLKPLLKRYALNGQTKDALSKSQAGSWKYDIVEQGFKFNMPDICAAIGLAQLRNYKELMVERKRVFKQYHNHFKDKSWAILPPSQEFDNESSYHLYMLRVKNINEDSRDRIIERISERDVAVNVHFIPLPMLSLFKELGYDITNYPVTYANYMCEISLPIYPQLSNEEVEYVIQVVSESVEKEL